MTARFAALPPRLRAVIRWAALGLFLLLSVLSVLVFRERRTALITLLCVILSLVLFYSGIENRRIGTRRLIAVAVMTAFSVVGRLIPFFKPVTALTVITAVYLGPEAGFLCGSLSALLSDFYFGQGPWTPQQMLAWGLIGLVAGLLARPLERSRILLLLYGALSGIAFSLVMDVWTVVWYNGGFSLSMYGAALLSAAPFTALYAASNCLFLWLIAPPIGRKLKRVKIKYGI